MIKRLDTKTIHLLFELTKKEVLLRYKRSVLGFAWSLLNPILMMLIFTMIFSRFPKMNGLNVPYYAFFLTGYIPWNFFATTCQNGKDAILANSGIVKQVAFERWTLPAAGVLSNLIHFALALALWTVYLAVHPGFDLMSYVALLPVIVLLQAAFLFGLVQFLSTLNVFFRDVGQILEVLTTFLFFLTPVFYSFTIFKPEDRLLVLFLKINPMAHFMILYRSSLLECNSFPFFSLFYIIVWTAAICILGGRFFSTRAKSIAKEL